jgi:hypothetical protein
MKNRRTISKMIGLQRATVVGVLQLLVLTTSLTAQQRRPVAASRRGRQHVQRRVHPRQDFVVERQPAEGALAEDGDQRRVRGESAERHHSEQESELRPARGRLGQPAILSAGHHVANEHLRPGRQGGVRLGAGEHQFANPATNISNVTFNPDGTIRALNGVGAITSTVRIGRQYDEREWRIGLRFGF